MEKTPLGTSVGVDDPYAVAGRCDHVTSDGRCRFAFDHAASDPEFARERRREGYRCPVAASISPAAEADDRDVDDRSDPDPSDAPTWRDCPHYRSRTRGDRCVRCGLRERRGSGSERPLLDEHHLSYPDSASTNRSGANTENDRKDENDENGGNEGDDRNDGKEGDETGTTHEITVSLCRWCHAKVHDSWARIDDDASPDPEAIAAREGRLTREHAESAFETAAERRSRK